MSGPVDPRSPRLARSAGEGAITSAIIAAACNLALRACSGDLERALGLLTNAPWRTVLRLELEDLRQDAKDAAAAP